LLHIPTVNNIADLVSWFFIDHLDERLNILTVYRRFPWGNES